MQLDRFHQFNFGEMTKFFCSPGAMNKYRGLL